MLYLNQDWIFAEADNGFPFIPYETLIAFLYDGGLDDVDFVYYTHGLRYRNPIVLDEEYTPQELLEALESGEIDASYYELAYDEDEDIYRFNSYSGNDLF